MNIKLGRSSLVGLYGALGCGLVWACGAPAPPVVSGGSAGGSSVSGAGAVGQPGEVGGLCRADNTCDANLACVAGVCLPTGLGSGGSTSLAAQGALDGACYPNNTCNAGLTCLDSFCLPNGVGVGGSGGGSAQGGAAQGGSTAQGGAAQGGSTAQGGAAHGGSTAQGGAAQGGAAQGGAAQGGSGGLGITPTTTIISSGGWIAPGSNTVGVVGSWFLYGDTYSTISAYPTGGVDFTGVGSQICVSGTVSQSDTYGPTIGFNLNQPDTTVEGYVPATYNVVGFSFGLSGTELPSALQVGYHTFGTTSEEYCTTIFDPVTAGNTVDISTSRLDCWVAGGAAASTSTSYQSLQFQLPVNYFADGQAFNFCITNVRAITN